MTSDDIKRIDIKEFREAGYLQELNRRFLHPLGLALEIIRADDGKETLGGIWDCRDSSGGMIYNLKESATDRLERFKKNKNFIDLEFEKRKTNRVKQIGSIIEEL